MPTSNHVLLYQFSDGALRLRLDASGRRHEKCYLFIKNSYFLLPSPFVVPPTHTSFPFSWIWLTRNEKVSHLRSRRTTNSFCRAPHFLPRTLVPRNLVCLSNWNVFFSFLFFYFLLLRFLFLNEKRLEINVILFNLALQTLECAGNSFVLKSKNNSHHRIAPWRQNTVFEPTRFSAFRTKAKALLAMTRK